MLLNNVQLRQNPHDIRKWRQRVRLFLDPSQGVVAEPDPAKAVVAYTEAVKTVDPMRATGKFSQLWIDFARFYEEYDDLENAERVFQKAVSVPFKSVEELAAWIDRVARANALSYELIFVDDGSSDNSWATVEQLKPRYPAIRGIRFSRNYGKSAALYCGFAAAGGEVVFTMDADLQDSPDEIPALRRMILDEGYDLVSGWKKKRYDPIGKRWPSKFFNWTARRASGIRLHDFNCGLKAYRRKVVKSIEVYGEMHRFIPILAKQAGFRRIGEKVVELTQQLADYRKTLLAVKARVETLQEAADLANATRKDVLDIIETTGIGK